MMKNWKIYVFTLTFVLSGWSAASLAAEFGGFQQRTSVFSQAMDDGGLCICEKVNGRWVCRPVGCIGTFSETSVSDQLKQRPVDRRILKADPNRSTITPGAPVSSADFRR